MSHAEFFVGASLVNSYFSFIGCALITVEAEHLLKKSQPERIKYLSLILSKLSLFF